MATERKSYTEEFKREAVRLMESSGKPVAQLARDLGINDNNRQRLHSSLDYRSPMAFESAHLS